MLTISSPGKPKEKAKVFILVTLVALATGCHSNGTSVTSPVVTDLGGVEPEPQASAQEFRAQCDSWKPDEESVAKFFSFSHEVPTRTYHHDFDTAPCRVRGTLLHNGITWTFEVNGAAKGLWRQGDTTVYFGCTHPSCAPLVMWEHVPMETID